MRSCLGSSHLEYFNSLYQVLVEDPQSSPSIMQLKKSSGEIVYWTGVQKIPNVGERLWHLAVLRLPRWHRQHVQTVPGPTTAGNVTQCYQDRGVWNPIQVHLVQITKVEETAASKCCSRDAKI
ncbi:60S ribosomal protein L18a-like isoform X1 [Vulpes lagopus]|uniref:60S ribosomal protein L18a-like isoform X1 n=1 Tax=Vulpes lagopus TaxID=494514 RepID=UPI001BCA37E3|nr:60S ribosomal protein L18a-like isoform X1 [Vulpes lagopus]XP_041598629.1 60S ribosomal protein L18a-like isoform X1 [Vulpes lagopus]